MVDVITKGVATVDVTSSRHTARPVPARRQHAEERMTHLRTRRHTSREERARGPRGRVDLIEDDTASGIGAREKRNGGVPSPTRTQKLLPLVVAAQGETNVPGWVTRILPGGSSGSTTGKRVGRSHSNAEFGARRCCCQI